MLGANKGRQKIFSILLVLFMMLSFTSSFPVTVKADSEPPEEAVSLTVTSGEPANNTSNIPVDTIPAPAPVEEEPAYSNDDIPMLKESDINKRKEMASAKKSIISAKSTSTWEISDYASLTVPPGKTREQVLVNHLLGTNVVAKNIVYTGTGNSAGTFKTAQNIIGFNEGIILSTGSVYNIPGPNSSDNISASNSLGGDADLNQLIPGYATHDATVLEFDFVPNTDNLVFHYIFASDEYNEWVDSAYNDVFGFFVNGQNVAQLPESNISVSINNVNLSKNSSFFINNDLSDGGGCIDTEMDGMTVVLDISAPVNAGTYNHIKLAIADAGDSIYDSNVFIQSGSFSGVPGSLTGSDAIDYIANFEETDDSGTIGHPAAEPVDTATGAYVNKRELLSVNGAQSLSFVIKYNSLLLKEGALGKGWGHNYESRIEELPDGIIKLYWNANQVNTFIYDTGNSYISPDLSTSYDRLEKQDDGSYILTRKNQQKYYFNQSGMLANVTNRTGQSLILGYDSSGKLDTITEPISSQNIHLSYDGQGLLDRISDNLNRQVSFSYDANHNLISITDAMGQTTTYVYDNEDRIVQIIDCAGITVFTNTYDEKGRIITQDDAKNDTSAFHFNYDEVSQPGNVKTTLIDRNGYSQEFVYDFSYRLLSHKNELGLSTRKTYDKHGNCTSITDTAGNTTSYTYDEFGNLTSRCNPAGNSTTMTYDDRNNPLTIQDPLGKTTSFVYDNNNNLTAFTDSSGNVSQYSYDNNGLLQTITLPNNSIYNFTYQDGVLKTLTDPSGRTSTNTYDGAGRLISISDPADKTTSFTYDPLDNLTRITAPLGHSTILSYDSLGNRTGITDANGNQTTMTYDNNENLILIKDAQNNDTLYEYDGEDRLIKTINARGSVTVRLRDASGRITGLTDPLGNTLTFMYDPVGNITGIKDAYGTRVSTIMYDSCYNPISTSDALGNTINKEFDQLNRLVKSINPLNQSTSFAYDNLDRLIMNTDAANGQACQKFDTVGNLVMITDPNNNSTTFTYDPSGLVKTVDSPAGSLSFNYNERGLLMELTNGRGQTSSYQYDDAGRLQSFTDAEGSVNYTYDANGNLLTTSDSSGTITREYDRLNRLVSYTDARGNTLQYSYDQAGNLTELSYPDGKVVSYDYDAANRLIKVSDWADRITSYNYDANGRLLETHRPDGSAEYRSYDAAGRTIQIKDCGTDGSLIKQYDLSYDAAGNITGEQVSPENQPYMLEDAVMNYNSGNRLESLNGEAINYDADGNITSAPINGKIEEFTFGSRNRLTAAGLATYNYDAENNRIAVKQNDSETSFVVNPNTHLSQVLVQTEPDGKQTYYVYGFGLIGQQDENGYGSYHFDLRGSTVALSNETGIITDTFQYGTYGELVNHTGTTSTPFLYNGRDGVMTDTNGLYYMRARYYNPEIKRFVSQDILLGNTSESQSLNRNIYCCGNPIIRIDPSGLLTMQIGITGTLACAIGVTGNLTIAIDDNGNCIGIITGGGGGSTPSGGGGESFTLTNADTVYDLVGWSTEGGISVPLAGIEYLEGNDYTGVNIVGGLNMIPVEIHAYRTYSFEVWVPSWIKSWAKKQISEGMEKLNRSLDNSTKRCINKRLGEELFDI